MFFCHPLPISLVNAENPAMAAENYFLPRPISGGSKRARAISTTYGFNLVINAKAAAEKQEVLP